jgi:hypothetical protein
MLVMTQKRIIGVLLSIIILLTMPLPAARAEDMYSSDVDAYIEEVLPKYLAIEYSEDYVAIQISQPLTVDGNTDANSRIFFVVNDGEYIGHLVVTSVGGAFHSSFRFDDNENVTAAIENDESIALFVNENDQLSIETNSTQSAVSGANRRFNAENSSTYHELSEIILSDVEFDLTDIISHVTDNETQAASSSYSVSLNVPYVANATTPQGDGLCWAACIAAVARYKLGGSATANNVYNALVNAFPNETPVGSDTWYSRGYSICGLVATLVSTGLPLTSLYTQLNADRPVIFRMTNGNSSHAIVCKSIYSDLYSGTVYGFMDPNYTNPTYISSSIPDKSINNSSFVYAGTQTYTSWYSTVY